MSSNIPLIVDLDHTLIDTDLLYESSIATLKKRPWLVAIYPFWLMQGKAYLKAQLIKNCDIDITTLPYNQTTINYIKHRQQQGTKIILATASNKFYAQQVAKHIGLFDDVMASDKRFNLSAHNKATKLAEHFGEQGFDYMGDNMRDLPVWQITNLAILVNASNKVIRKTQHLNRLVLSRK